MASACLVCGGRGGQSGLWRGAVGLSATPQISRGPSPPPCPPHAHQGPPGGRRRARGVLSGQCGHSILAPTLWLGGSRRPRAELCAVWGRAQAWKAHGLCSLPRACPSSSAEEASRVPSGGVGCDETLPSSTCGTRAAEGSRKGDGHWGAPMSPRSTDLGGDSVPFTVDETEDSRGKVTTGEGHGREQTPDTDLGRPDGQQPILRWRRAQGDTACHSGTRGALGNSVSSPGCGRQASQ